MSSPMNCPICSVPATLKCGGCKNVVYCGKEHQKEHWKKEHKAKCKCFEIIKNSILGRHLIATRDIKKGEVILRESPLIIGPKLSTYPICLGCHVELSVPNGQKNYYKCSQCGWPLCGPMCEKSKYHKPECEVMAKRKFNCNINYDGVEPKKEAAYCVITPIRCLLMRNSNPKLYEKIIDLEDHLEKRIDTSLYAILKSNLLTFVQKILGFDDLSETEILRTAAILDTNSFEIRLPKKMVKIRALFYDSSMLSHDCIPNTKHVFNNNLENTFIATVNIPKGAIISTSYTQALKSTLLRREHLLQAKCFECTCTRCSDVTEMGTFMGAIMCSKCKVGKIVSLEPLDSSVDWKCQLCPHTIKAKQILWGHHALQKEIEDLDKKSPRPYEEFLIRYRDTLHDKNTHVLQVKYALLLLYGNTEGFLLNELTDAGVQRKVDLCQELLEIADLFAPGWSRFRGTLLLDLQEILAVQAKREFEKGLLTKEATQEKLMESMELLTEAVKILKVELDLEESLQARVANLAKEID